MSAALPVSNTCCDPCEEPVTVQVPGPQGTAGAAGTNGTNGQNAFTTADSFVMPAELANVTVNVVNSDWMVGGQVVFAGGGGAVGYFEVQSKPNSTSVILKNLEDAASNAYLSNSAPATVFPDLTNISPGGLQGPASFAGAAIYSGNGSPEGVVTAAVGSLYTDVLTGDFYKKISGAGNTGWA